MADIQIKLDPVNLARIAFAHERSGNLAKAREIVDKASKLEPDNPVARFVDARLHRRNGNFETALTRLEKLAQKIGDDHEISATVRFDIAEVHDKLGNHRQALVTWTQANRLQIENPEIQLTDMWDFQKKVTLWQRSDYQNLPSFPDSENRRSPAFMVGFPRSGTTLLHHMLADHPKIQVMEEISILHQISQDIPEYSASLATATESQVKKWRDEYWKQVTEKFDYDSGLLLIDKLPLSMIHIPLIKVLFPDAKVILSLRHPCDCVFSNFTQQYSLNTAMSSFTTLRDSIITYANVFSLWNHYRNQINFECHEIRYEDLTADVDLQQGKILDFLGIAATDRTLDHKAAASERFVSTPSYYDITQPVYTRSIGRWQQYKNLLNWPPNKLAPFIRQFGYDDPETR